MTMQLRDRDSIITEDGFIFRVYGYIHPENEYICDPEYAKPEVFKSSNPRACRGKNELCYCKFFADEGMKLILDNYSKYSVFFWPLQKCVVGVNKKDIAETRKPDQRLQQLLTKKPDNALLKAMKELLEMVSSKAGLSETDFGVFGSLLHGFYHPDFSDLDFTVYGAENMKRLRDGLERLYKEDNGLRNEFDSMEAVSTKDWKFVNYSLNEYVWHQKRKMIYAYFDSQDANRVVKAEFEPVKDYKEINNEYSPFIRTWHEGWIKAEVEITDDNDAPFIPSIYKIKVKQILEGPQVDNIQRIFSYMEEFRMQAKTGETVLVEGNLERVVNGTDVFHQIVLSYGPRYYEQTLKVIKS